VGRYVERDSQCAVIRKVVRTFFFQDQESTWDGKLGSNHASTFDDKYSRFVEAHLAFTTNEQTGSIRRKQRSKVAQ
jgi:hypothetical protein